MDLFRKTQALQIAEKPVPFEMSFVLIQLFATSLQAQSPQQANALHLDA